MRILHPLALICIACVLAGCPRREPTLDEAIDALPDEWGIYSEKFERFARKAGTTVLNRESSTNNWLKPETGIVTRFLATAREI